MPLVANLHPIFKIAPPLLLVFILEPIMVAYTGGTPGHHIMGLRILNAQTGAHIGVLRALGRALMRGLLGWLSFIIALTSRKHQALHDLAAGTAVVLREPERYPPTEKFAERIDEAISYTYPSKLRRTLVIIGWNIVGFIILILGIGIFISGDCLERDICTFSDEMWSQLLAWVWIAYFGATIVMGWRGQLPGCRRVDVSDSRSP